MRQIGEPVAAFGAGAVLEIEEIPASLTFEQSHPR
jgi:hypothetical protein